MRYVVMIRSGFVVAGDLNDEEIREHLSNGYRMKWQQTLSTRSFLTHKRGGAK